MLLAFEAALTGVLLFGAVLLARSYGRLVSVDLGFETRNAISASFTLPPQRYPTSQARTLFCGELLELVRRIPAVESATLGPIPGLMGGDRALLKDGVPLPNAGVFLVGSGYFRTRSEPEARMRSPAPPKTYGGWARPSRRTTQARTRPLAREALCQEDLQERLVGDVALVRQRLELCK